jgi:hypothetical protein
MKRHKCALRLGDGDSGRQPTEELELRETSAHSARIAAHNLGLHRHRHPEVSRPTNPIAGECARRNTDDVELRAIHRERSTDDVRVAVKPSGPVRVTDHSDWMRAERDVVVSGENAADPRSDAEHREEISCDDADALLPLADASSRPTGLDVKPVGPCGGGHVGKDRRALAETLVVGVGEVGELAAIGQTLLESDQLLRCIHWKHPKQECVGNAEDRGVGADAQRQGEYDDDGERWRVT